jgi:hypothetical protein
VPPPVHLPQVVAQHRLLCPGVKGGGASSPFDVLELCGDRLLLKLPLRRFEVYDVSACAAVWSGGGTRAVWGQGGAGEARARRDALLCAAWVQWAARSGRGVRGGLGWCCWAQARQTTICC